MTAEIQMPQQHIAIISHSGLHEPWREIVHMGTHLVFPRSHYNHQATTDCFYFIDKGRVRLTYTNAAGEDHVVMFFGKGCIFNETSVITGDEATMACFRATIFKFTITSLSCKYFVIISYDCPAR